MMASLHFVICAVLLLSGGASPFRKEIKRRMSNTRIVGGEVSYIENMPYMVSLMDSGDFFCGGSILNACYVLTSAGCVFGKDPRVLTIRGGSTFFNESGKLFAARSIVVHPKYSDGHLEYNVALIQTSSPMELGETIVPITLVDKEPEESELVTVAGWGELEEGKGFQHQIHSAVVNVIDRVTCKNIHDEKFPVTKSMICTSEIRGERGACRGDDGGPVVYSNQLAGVMSEKLGCGSLPDIHANIANPEIREFITTNMGEECK